MAEPDGERPKNTESVKDLTGTAVGRFVIRARLGAGAMGEVYRAEDTVLKRPVALKRMATELRGDERYRQRFLKEAERASSLSDHHIAGVYDVLVVKDEVFLVMEYVEGSTLRQRLREALGIEEFLSVATQCAEALVAAHEKGIVHRDLKPENIMLTPRGHVKVLDFGVAKRLPVPDEAGATRSLGTQRGTLSGTPAYMAPEVLLEKESDGRADIFSLGVAFYEALTGRHPFLADSFMATSDRILHEDPPPPSHLNPQVPAELDRIVAKMLAKVPARRCASAAELLRDLRALSVPGLRLRRRLRLRLTRRQRVGLATTLAVVLVLSLIAVPGVRLRLLRWTSGARIPAQKNLVVVPFQAIGGGPENQAYCDGLTETLTAKLTRLTASHGLLVAPATEVRVRRVASAEAARKELGGNLVLEGSMHRSGNKLRINYALVETTTLRTLRAETITADSSDPFAVQDRVVEGAVAMLELELVPTEREGLATYGTQVAGAYDFYLQGRGYLQNYERAENIENALQNFQRALKLDPNYVLAYAGLGEAYWKKYEGSKESQWVGRAREACERAVSADARLAAAHICLGTLWNGTGEALKAAAEFSHALELEPTSDAAYRGLASAEERLGKLDEAEKAYRRAIELRPRYWASYSWLGAFYYHIGRFEKAAQMFERVTQLAPENHRGYYNLGAAYYLLGRWANAEQVYKKSIALKESAAGYSNLGALYFFQGRFTEAARMFEKAVQVAPKDEFVRGNLADAYRWTPGDSDKAAQTYAQAITLAEEQLRVDPRSAEALAHLALYQAKTGHKAEALRAIGQATTLAPRDVNRIYNAAMVYHLVGDNRQALVWLRKAVEGGYPVREIRAEPELKNLHDDPIFKKLVGSP